MWASCQIRIYEPRCEPFTLDETNPMSTRINICVCRDVVYTYTYIFISHICGLCDDMHNSYCDEHVLKHVNDCQKRTTGANYSEAGSD